MLVSVEIGDDRLIQRNTVVCADCLSTMQGFDENCIDAIVTDPPYGLEFMGKEWDHGIPGVHFWQEALRVVKPGAHMLAFGGTRTHHRLMVAIEDAGWEIRDCLMWVYGSGFPKSLDVSKAIDKAAGVEREDKFEGAIDRFAGPTGNKKCEKCGKWLVSGNPCKCPRPQDNPQSDAAKQWSGWGTALKPSWEPVILCRKPLEGTVAENVQKWGTGGINIDGCRVEHNGRRSPCKADGGVSRNSKGVFNGGHSNSESWDTSIGRFPANLIHDGSDEVLALFPETSSGKPCGTKHGGQGNAFGYFNGDIPVTGIGDSGSAARFFYSAKADSTERNKYLKGKPAQKVNDGRETPIDNAFQRGETLRKNIHPTVKPVDLLQYLCRLITPPKGTVLDPFAGSGSTGIAAFNEGFDYILIEIDPEYAEIARIRNAQVRLPI